MGLGADTQQNSAYTAVVADDEIHIANLLAHVLADLGVRALVVNDGERALAAVWEHRPRLLLTDVMMPRLRGDRLCQRIKSDPATAQTIVVVITSLPASVIADCPADAVVAKPFDIDQVEGLVRRLLGDGAAVQSNGRE